MQKSEEKTNIESKPIGGRSITTNRIVVHPTSYWETLVHLLKGNVGAGLFAMGYAYKNAGLLGGFIGTLFIGGICIYCSHLLLWSSAEIRRKLNMDADPTFEETVEYCFECGPKCYRRNSKYAGILVKVFIVVTQMGFCCVFFVFVAESFGLVLDERGICLPNVVYILGMYVIMLVACSVPHLKHLTPVSLAGSVFLLFGIVSILVVSSLELPSPSERPAFASVASWPLFFGGVVYAFEGIALIIPLKLEMKHPERFVSKFGVFNVGMLIVLTLFNCVGFMGYLRYGEDVEGSVSLNLEPSTFTHVVKIVVALGIAFSYPIQMFVASTIVCNLASSRLKGSLLRWKPLVTLFIKMIIVSVTCLIAIYVPNLGTFISLIGAVSSTALALVFPVLCHISLASGPPEFEPSRSAWLPLLYTMDAVALFLAGCGFATGTYFSIKDMMLDPESSRQHLENSTGGHC